MKLSDYIGSQLPKINLKKFDNVRNNYGSIPCFFETPQQMKSAQKTKQVKQNVLKNKQSQSINKNRTQKSFSLLNNSQLKLKYQTKSLSFYKSASKALLTTNINEDPMQITQDLNPFQMKANLRQIDTKFILEKIPRLKVAKSQSKIKITTNTKYENWFPKKNKLREIQNIRNQNYLKLQKFQNSFFFKCRNNSTTLLKLTKSQQIN